MSKPNVFIIESLNFEDEEDDRFEGKVLSKILKLNGVDSQYYYIRTKQELDEIIVKFDESDYRYFEANCFAFFRAFHALLESLPYLLNIMLEVKIDPEFRFLSWKTITESCTKKQIFDSEIVMINNLLESDTYKELNHFVNVSKHRRIVRIDSGLLSESSKPKLCKDDLDIEFKTYDIDTIMQTVFDDLHVKAIDLLKSFLNSFSDKYS